jgi:hypothetical protein
VTNGSGMWSPSMFIIISFRIFFRRETNDSAPLALLLPTNKERRQSSLRLATCDHVLLTRIRRLCSTRAILSAHRSEQSKRGSPHEAKRNAGIVAPPQGRSAPDFAAGAAHPGYGPGRARGCLQIVDCACAAARACTYQRKYKRAVRRTRRGRDRNRLTLLPKTARRRRVRCNTRANQTSRTSGEAPQHGGEAFVVAGACKFLLNPRADVGLSARLVGAVGVAEVRVTARALPHGEAWCAAVIVNRCRSLLAARSGRFELAHPAQPQDFALPAPYPGYGREGKGRLGPCLNVKQLPRSGRGHHRKDRKTHCAASTCPARWIGTRLANPVPSPASP